MPDVTMFLIYFLFAFTLTQCFGNPISPAQDDKLIGVAVLFRHGDRSPIESYPNDPYIDIKYWPEGLGQLLDSLQNALLCIFVFCVSSSLLYVLFSNSFAKNNHEAANKRAGKKRQFDLGRWLRARYDGFLPERYNYQDIFVESSDVDRTLMSAAANLAGLYYLADKSSCWQENLPWSPVPVHTRQRENDNLLSLKKSCPNSKKLAKEVENSKYFKGVLSEHGELKAYVERHTNWTIDGIAKLKLLYSTFYVYSNHNSSYIPKWADKINMTELRYLAGLTYTIETYTLEQQRLVTGPFFNYLHKYFRGFLDGSKPRFLMLSAHDTNLVNILNTYGVYDYHPVVFAEALIWELYRNKRNETYLRMFNKGSTDDLIELFPKGCSKNCSYAEYLRKMEPINISKEEWKKECKRNNQILM